MDLERQIKILYAQASREIRAENSNLAELKHTEQKGAIKQRFAEKISLECIKAVDEINPDSGDAIIEHFGLR